MFRPTIALTIGDTHRILLFLGTFPLGAKPSLFHAAVNSQDAIALPTKKDHY